MASSSSKDLKTAWDYLNPKISYGEFTDGRDDHTYKTVEIGNQMWMAVNLNYEHNEGTAKSYCYNNSADFCAKYGRLYTWAAAMDSAVEFSSDGAGCGYGKICSPSAIVRGVCPSGWRLPGNAEWNTLFAYVGGTSSAGTVLKSTSGWYDNGNDNDTYGFAVLPAGYGGDGGYFYYAGYSADFWSFSEDYSDISYNEDFYYNDPYVDDFSNDKANALSVRCFRD